MRPSDHAAGGASREPRRLGMTSRAETQREHDRHDQEGACADWGQKVSRGKPVNVCGVGATSNAGLPAATQRAFGGQATSGAHPADGHGIRVGDLDGRRCRRRRSRARVPASGVEQAAPRRAVAAAEGAAEVGLAGDRAHDQAGVGRAVTAVAQTRSRSATNGLSHSSCCAGRPLVAPVPGMNPPGALTPDVAQNCTRRPSADRQRQDDRKVRTVAVWVRLTSGRDEQADGAHAERRSEQQHVGAHQVVRPDAAEDEDDGRHRERGDDQQEDVDERPSRACR